MRLWKFELIIWFWHWLNINIEYQNQFQLNASKFMLYYSHVSNRKLNTPPGAKSFPPQNNSTRSYWSSRRCTQLWAAAKWQLLQVTKLLRPRVCLPGNWIFSETHLNLTKILCSIDIPDETSWTSAFFIATTVMKSRLKEKTGSAASCIRFGQPASVDESTA